MLAKILFLPGLLVGGAPVRDSTLLSGLGTAVGGHEVALPSGKLMSALAASSMCPAFLQTLIHLPFLLIISRPRIALYGPLCSLLLRSLEFSTLLC